VSQFFLCFSEISVDVSLSASAVGKPSVPIVICYSEISVEISLSASVVSKPGVPVVPLFLRNIR